jgi:uncharacterized membrane protein
MTNEEAIVRLLTEMRDMQQEEIAWRHKVTEQSLRLQGSGIRTQRVALVVVALIVAAVLTMWAYLAIPQERAVEEDRPPQQRHGPGGRVG